MRFVRRGTPMERRGAAAYAAALSGSGTTFGAVLTGPGTLGAVVLIVVQQVYFKITDALSGTKAKKA